MSCDVCEPYAVQLRQPVWTEHRTAHTQHTISTTEALTSYSYITLTIYLANLFLLTDVLPQQQINITK